MFVKLFKFIFLELFHLRIYCFFYTVFFLIFVYDTTSQQKIIRKK